jgi:hypothetical protein
MEQSPPLKIPGSAPELDKFRAFFRSKEYQSRQANSFW